MDIQIREGVWTYVCMYTATCVWCEIHTQVAVSPQPSLREEPLGQQLWARASLPRAEPCDSLSNPAVGQDILVPEVWVLLGMWLLNRLPGSR